MYQTQKHHFALSALTVALFSTLAQAETTQLDQIIVSSSNEGAAAKIAETKKSAKQLERQQAQDARDIVRYETGVTVVEAGRFGNSGYAIRGVDENRVAVQIDGLQQAETISSQGFKDIFEGYGNFNNTRNSAEIETLKEVTIRKGADSIKVGSGALGGSVSFITKDARDYLTQKNYYGSYKIGYNTADNQLLNTYTLAGRYKWFDALLVATRRDGHELENFGYKHYNSTTQGMGRQKADPYHKTLDSTLAKFSFQPNEENRFTVAADLYENRARGYDFSYSLYSGRVGSNGDPINEKELRHTNDKTTRSNYAFTFENYTSTPFWDTLKLTYSEQKIKTRARTEDYCDGNEQCDSNRNDYGVQLKDNQIVGPNSKPLTIYEERFKTPKQLRDDNTLAEINLQTARDKWLDCSLVDCNKPMWAYKQERPFWQHEPVNFDEFSTDASGRKFARISQMGYYFPWPNSTGYFENSYVERDLDTKTKQLNLDLSKQFSLATLENHVEYGFGYNHTKKSMVNRQGYSAHKPQWWAERYTGSDCKFTFNALACPKQEPENSFLIPVTAKNGALYFADNIVVNPFISFDIGYRYDRVKYKPEYVAGVSPKIPDGLVTNLYTTEPKFDPNKLDPSAYPDNIAKRRQNAEANIAQIAQPKKFSASSYALATKINPLDWLQIQAKYSKGFRAPTSDEIYFTFLHPSFSVKPNKDLQAETAKTAELALTLHNDWGFITTSYFQSRYRNFIDLVMLELNHSLFSYQNGQAKDSPVYQHQNRQTAKVTGIEINSKFNAGKLHDSLEGLAFSYKFTKQRGKVADNLLGSVPMNAIQPQTSVFGIHYDHPSQRFGADLHITYASQKRVTDTYNTDYPAEYDAYKRAKKADPSAQIEPPSKYARWQSKHYRVIDFSVYAKPLKNLTLRAGVYNLTNEKYSTWDSVRSIRSYGTANMIAKKTIPSLGLNYADGWERFYAPERNYRLSAQLEF